MPDTPRPRILIVDDEAAQMKALCDTLQDHDYETVGFSSGKAALELLQKTKFDLLLTDLTMPEMDGIALLQEARKTDSNLIGIIMTGAGTITSAVEAMKAGAFDYILKPFELSIILPVLSRALAVRQLRMDNAVLEQRVRERTVELEAANKELEAFSYSVSHDLRSPLNHIMGFSSILRDRYAAQMPVEAQRLLNIVTTGTKRMGQLIEDLLRLSHLGRQPLTRRPVKIEDLVHRALDTLRDEQNNCNIEVRLGELPDSIGDPSLLEQVFVNLISNAFKYTRQQAQPLVEIGCLQQDGQNSYYVRDNGVGFNMQYAGKLFGAFQRLHRADEFEGTGIGLSIVHRIIQRHGGRIWAEAEVDKGATFFFTLPG